MGACIIKVYVIMDGCIINVYVITHFVSTLSTTFNEHVSLRLFLLLIP